MCGLESQGPQWWLATGRLYADGEGRISPLLQLPSLALLLDCPGANGVLHKPAPPPPAAGNLVKAINSVILNLSIPLVFPL